ncbi:coiled-coil domain-containing protein 134-like [Eupeodes corollae]|uniref:coiled-coil domain-containing protein 134-like n=1 Tax=Eupeodes corollae TaxID=290404 RepID=UPI002492EA8A|nr:coiled-coil domain-containing protein 134-like [Eupeodes corollae]XP_055904901.1 coiled-coil domain-containing protein 134-like [Eupeodes corollae]
MKHIHTSLWVLLLCVLITTVISEDNKDEGSKKVPLTPRVYVKLLQTRRKDHTTLIQRMLQNDYSKNYKMMSLALDKIFQIIKQSNQTLTDEKYSPITDGFPVEQRVQEAVTLLIEDTCLASDIILHFPEISQKVLKKIPQWKETINWCLDFVMHYPHIIDEVIVQLIDLARQEINEDARSPDFINPYYKKVEVESVPTKKPNRRVKKIKKGPQLSSRSEL